MSKHSQLVISLFIGFLFVLPIQIHANDKNTIGGEFKKSGSSAGHGSKELGKNIVKGHPIRAGKGFGIGIGGFGKHLGKGIGKTTKKIFT